MTDTTIVIDAVWEEDGDVVCASFPGDTMIFRGKSLRETKKFPFPGETVAVTRTLNKVLYKTGELHSNVIYTIK